MVVGRVGGINEGLELVVNILCEGKFDGLINRIGDAVTGEDTTGKFDDDFDGIFRV